MALESKKGMLTSLLKEWQKISSLYKSFSKPFITHIVTSASGTLSLGGGGWDVLIYWYLSQKTGQIEQDHLHSLLNSETVQTFIDKQWIEDHSLTLHSLPKPIHISNADGSTSSHGQLQHCISFILSYQGHSKDINSLVVTLETYNLILSYN